MSATIDHWDDYIAEYEQGMQSAQSAYDAMTPAEQSQEAINIAKQSAYLTWLKSERDALVAMEEQGQPLPATVSITNAYATVRVYMVAGDSTVYTAIPRTISGNPYGQTVITAPHFDVYISTLSWFDGNDWHTEGEGCDSTPYSDGWQVGCTPEFPWATRYVVEYADRKGFLTANSISGASKPTKLGSLPHPAYGAVPTLREGDQINISQSCVYALFGSGSEYNLTGDVDTEKPWDYYNDNLIPTNPSIAAFPDGYDPKFPPEKDDDNPDDEPDVDEVDGELPDLNLDADLTTPALFITQYILTAQEVSSIGEILWSSWNDPNSSVSKNFLFNLASDSGTFDITSALDFVISLRYFPFDIRTLFDHIGTCSGVYMGTGHTNFLPSPQGQSVWYLTTQIHALSAGKVKLYPHKPYKDFRDIYNTSIVAFLPFCGTVELNPAEVIYKEVSCYYLIDFSTGGCTAVLFAETDNGRYMVASKSGQLGFPIPLTATNAGQVAAQYMRDATNAIGKIGGFFFDAASSIANSAEQLAKAAAKAEKKGEEFNDTGMTASSTIGISKKGFNTFLDLFNQGLNMLSRSCIDVPMMSGGGSAEALLLSKCPYIQIRRGLYSKPDNYPHSVGYINSTSNLIKEYKGKFTGNPSTGMPSDKGFCKFTGIDTTGLHCHEEEKSEIIQLLENGVYL